ncbi:MAG: FHA domain-containing protein [Gammaproteobacteria bacterium]|jgi:class 3 adenylate cyclase|nr:FHA domain-containing protein [Gammaproteobacteria bacterium]MBT3723869.1 FHA domain-containing protein [Gammaproteobacteria bacterium]MBT4076011.1 FHA domain-containing protein [Gammaproteobacteria bacterium]MBT4193954.1 FHA domain-containing protein [Gammaproteobacteria bacterium]MBT4452341.1 FHA domain-containing protein [Gammaproteobacteria bacterium]
MKDQSIQCVVMFADVAGSTAMYENMGDSIARERISKALNTLIAICKRHKGRLVKTIGDEILVYFPDVDLSLIAAQAIQETIEDDRSPETIGLSIRIGMHYGSVILADNDIFGDTVNVAARVVALTKARQILFTNTLVERVSSAEINGKMRHYDRLDVKGKDKKLDVFMYAWEEESEITNMATGNLTNPFRAINEGGLVLTYQSQTSHLNLDSDTINIGRGNSCELIISGDLISRFHAKISVRRGKFVLTDQSTNGTFVRTLDGQNYFLRQEELTLFGSGVISLGKNVDKSRENLLYYSFD